MGGFEVLSTTETGVLVEISGIVGGWGVRRRLWELGLRPGTKLTVIIGGPLGGPLLLEDVCTGLRVSLGRGLASRILVRKVHERQDV